ncbi:cell wall / vacuolar inhibitor of fructosidase 1-like [Rosa rugosa]|uniref:cell wall / vacuolar inhibitor of fructosidase 1-like n=1 Tax=Rosa rugosa TaxID=74645 RepID=UPI002B408596|nr:cell wall / vacuolar inhibitor of fructosidase 1-like [Rosa rugosa]
MDAKLIDETCQKTPNPNLCVSSLKSDPRSSDADVKGLGVIMVDVVKAKAIIGQNKAQELLKQSPGDLRLKVCSGDYDRISNHHVPNALLAFKKDAPDIAEEDMSEAAEEARACESSFSGGSPLTDVNNVLADVAAITAAIAKELVG